jgi:hypothetical protein
MSVAVDAHFPAGHRLLTGRRAITTSALAEEFLNRVVSLVRELMGGLPTAAGG